MSDGAHNGHDDIGFYEADIGYTWELSVTDGGVSLDDDQGPLPPGRYLIHAFNLSPDTGVCWVHAGAAKTVLSLAASAGRKRFPLNTKAIIALETHVRAGDSDKIGAITTSGATCTLFISLVSTKTPGCPMLTRGYTAPGGSGSGTSSDKTVFINRNITTDISVPADCTLLLRDPILADGVNITIATGGEVYVL